uniref:Haem-binding uptake Tiki superfamily ChaN domain-containing protein n=1 Tax=Chromera velia CCMP2878 TaxID=1169474 RepID=A0A0G4I9A0_9ALVE|eukprot:Cvel_2038.t1-p1 / transcript=Cvel_2038.t1 / gene=Cvel_2038 / organism=Chromera_velia_CCMP2878 / gene_product=hypothetical protein / transcript_product=hypothetical protein / location=Cvel_scaffold78:70434-76627(+) / protein_length=466 / sequence_SO=supercontig / SO=protein_coding / is_pseudo=false
MSRRRTMPTDRDPMRCGALTATRLFYLLLIAARSSLRCLAFSVPPPLWSARPSHPPSPSLSAVSPQEETATALALQSESRRDRVTRAVGHSAAAAAASSLQLLSGTAGTSGSPRLFLPPQAAAESQSRAPSLDGYKAFRLLQPQGDGESPSLRALDTSELESFIKAAAQPNSMVFLGEHHNRKEDHELQAQLVDLLAMEAKSKGLPFAVGFEQVETPFQKVLDQFGVGKLSLEGLEDKTEWKVRWQWPFELYTPIFDRLRGRRIPLLALNPSDADTETVMVRGFPGLSQAKLRELMPDSKGFAEQAKQPGFRQYTTEVILSSYGAHVQMGVLGDSPDPKNFFAARVLRDEAMAARGVEFVKSNPGGVVAMLMGGDHVKFRFGSSDRALRMGRDGFGLKDFQVTSVMLNPTSEDSVSSRRRQLRLSLTEESPFLPLADLLIFNSDKAPPGFSVSPPPVETPKVGASS